MKYLLFLLLVLGWTVAASAQYGIDVLVYDMKASNSGYGYVADTNTWTKIKDTNTAFLIVEEVTYNTANVRAVYTWKGKDKQKYAMDVNMGTVIMKSEELGSTEKQIGFLIDVNTNTASRLQLSGASKTVTIGRKKSRSCLNCHSSEEVETLDDLGREGCPKSMKGYEIKNITYASSSKKLCTSKVSLKLDIAKTFAAHGSIYTAEEEASALLSDLYYAGYNIVEP